MRTRRTYKLINIYMCRIHMKKRVLVFEFWNDYEETGYEVHVMIHHDVSKAYDIAYHYIGQTHNIIAWDELITCVKADLIKEG